jgi:CubicO group peptidase (beta-lactamase class C family)
MWKGGVSGVTARQRRVEIGIWQEPQAYPRAGLATTIEAAMARHRVPGCAVATIADGRLDWAHGYGVTASAGAAAPVGVDTIFQACSISKAVAATVALQLVQAGRLDLDADVNDALTAWHVPANDGWQPRVTLRHLLSHTAGLTYCWYPGHRRDAMVVGQFELGVVGGQPT